MSVRYSREQANGLNTDNSLRMGLRKSSSLPIPPSSLSGYQTSVFHDYHRISILKATLEMEIGGWKQDK